MEGWGGRGEGTRVEGREGRGERRSQVRSGEEWEVTMFRGK